MVLGVPPRRPNKLLKIMRRFLRFYLSGLGILCTACLSPSFEWQPEPPRATFGEVVYELSHRAVGAGSICVDERIQLLQQNQTGLIDHVDGLVASDTVEALSTTMEASIVPLIESNDLPQLTDDLHRALALLVDNARDPHREALGALVDVLTTTGSVGREQITRFIERSLESPHFDNAAKASLHLFSQPHGGSSWGEEAARLFKEVLTTFAPSDDCAPFRWPKLETTLLQESSIFTSGPPAWSVRIDHQGKPRIAHHPITGMVPPPFSDLNGEGQADPNNVGEATGPQGFPIDLAPFGHGEGRDAYGRAVTNDGQTVFQYFDSKSTPLAALVDFTGRAIANDIHGKLVEVMDAIENNEQTCIPSTPDCFSNEQPRADMVFLLLESLNFHELPNLLASWHALFESHPQESEALLVGLGTIIEKLSKADNTPPSRALLALMADLMPIFADIFSTDAASEQSVASTLLTAIDEMGPAGRDMPKQLAWNMSYGNLHKTQTCSSELPNLTLSTPVDFQQERFFLDATGATIDNRSGFEKTIELFSKIDCGSVPFTDDQTLAEVVLETIAGSDTATVCSAIDTSLSFMSMAPSLSATMGPVALDLIGCSGDQVWPDLMALDMLTKSGVIDVYIPIAKAFVELGQADALLELFHVLAEDLKRDELEAPKASSLRPLLPKLASILESSSVTEPIFDMMEIMAETPINNGVGNTRTTMLELVAYLTQNTSPIPTRSGRQSDTSLASEIIVATDKALAKLAAQGATHHLQSVLKHFSQYLTKTTSAPANLITGTNDNAEQLQERRLVPLLSSFFAYVGQLEMNTPQLRSCHLDALQRQSNQWFDGINSQQLTHLLRAFTTSQEKGSIDQLLQQSLRTQSPVDIGNDLHGAGMSLFAGLLSLPKNSFNPKALIDYLLDIVDEIDIQVVARVLGRSLFEDDSRVLLTILERSLDHGPSDNQESTFDFLTDLVGSLMVSWDENACLPLNGGQDKMRNAEQTVLRALDFLENETTGLPALYQIVLNRNRGE